MREREKKSWKRKKKKKKTIGSIAKRIENSIASMWRRKRITDNSEWIVSIYRGKGREGNEEEEGRKKKKQTGQRLESTGGSEGVREREKKKKKKKTVYEHPVIKEKNSTEWGDDKTTTNVGHNRFQYYISFPSVVERHLCFWYTVECDGVWMETEVRMCWNATMCVCNGGYNHITRSIHQHNLSHIRFRDLRLCHSLHYSQLVFLFLTQLHSCVHSLWYSSHRPLIVVRHRGQKWRLQEEVVRLTKYWDSWVDERSEMQLEVYVINPFL